MLSATDLSKRFGAFTALDSVSLDVPPGKLVALLGPSGSGKTTLLRIIAGLEHADPGSGRILLHGEDVTDVPAGKRGVGFVFQHYALFRHLSVFDNIAFGLHVLPRRERPASDVIAARVRELLELMQLDGVEKRYPTQLSGGQRQRVAFARALAVQPRVLLLDEPFGALDAKVRKELRRWLRRFHDQTRLTTVFVTHDQEEALEIADEVVIMNQARVEQTGAPEEVYDHPRTPFVYRFLGNVNRVQLPWGTRSEGLDLPFAEPHVAYVRPHDIEIRRAQVGDGGERAIVRSVHAVGPLVRVTCERAVDGGYVEIESSRPVLDEVALRVGSEVVLHIRKARTFAEEYSI